MSDTSKTDKSYDLIEDYRDFCNDEMSSGVSPGFLPSLEDFEATRKAMSNPDSLGLVSPNRIGGLVGSLSANPSIRRMLDVGVAAVSEEGQRQAAKVAERLSSGEAFVKVKRAFSDGGGSGTTGAGGDGSSSNPFNANRMNYNPKPVEVRLDTGLKSRGYGDYYPASKPGLNVLEITQCAIVVPGSIASKLKTYFDTVTAFNFQNEAQMNVSFNVNAINNFTSEKLRQYMNAYANAYSKYVAYTSIISYCNDPLQTNEGIRALRAFITPQLMDDLAQLQNMLEGTPAPPKFREWIHFLYGGFFKVSGNPGSAIRFLSPTVLQTGTGTGSPLTGFPAADVQIAINQMFAVRETTALMARIQPSWIPGHGGLDGGSAVPMHSPNYNAIWENLPYAMEFSGSPVYGPAVAGEDNDVLYGSSADILDGAATAIWNGFDTNATGATLQDQFRPGTILPQMSTAGANKSNRISYHYVNSTVGSIFMCSNNMPNAYEYSRNETWTVTANQSNHGLIWPGRELINNINIGSTRQTNYEFYAKLFAINPSTKKDTGYKGGGHKRGGRRRGSGAKKGSIPKELLDEIKPT